MDGSKRREWLKGVSKKKSKSFLLPMLETSLIHINKDKDINYLIDVSFIQIGFPQIVLIFDNVDYVPLKEDIHRLSMKSSYIGAEYDDEEKEVCMFFDVPTEFKKDFELFTHGKYSQFSEKYKKVLTNIYTTKRDNGVSPSTMLPNVSMYDVLYPTNDLRKLMAKQLSTDNHIVDWTMINEILDPPNIELEEFKTIEELYDKI